MAISVKKAAVMIGALGVLALAASLFVYGTSQSPKSSYIDPSNKQLVADGKHIYVQNCASCHGIKLEGEPARTAA